MSWLLNDLAGGICSRSLRWPENCLCSSTAPVLVSGWADLILNVETIVIDRVISDRDVRLLRMAWSDEWGGHPGLDLFARADGAILGEYHQPWIHDADPDEMVQPIDMLIRARSRFTLSMVNRTDGATSRPIGILISGRYETGGGK